MNFSSFYDLALEFWPGLTLERILSRKFRKITNNLIFVVIILSGALFLFTTSDRALGLFFILSSIALASIAFDTLATAFYFKSASGSDRVDLSFELAHIIVKTPKRASKDIVPTFFKSPFAKNVLGRCGISPDDFKKFIKARKEGLSADQFSVESENFTFLNYSRGLMDKDKELAGFFLKYGIQKKDFLHIVSWLEGNLAQAKKEERWWSRENLIKKSGVGRSWGFGETYEIQKFSHNAATKGRDWQYLTQSRQSVISLLETTLSRGEEANAVLIGEDGTGRMEIVAGLARKAGEGKSTKELNYRQFVVIDHNYLVSSSDGKLGFEKQLLKILNQANSAGNIVLVFEDLPSFMNSIKSIGSDLADMLNPYLDSSKLKVIAISDRDSFHRLIEPNTHLSSKFETVEVEEDDIEGLREFLLSSIGAVERKEKVYFTFQAVRRTADGAVQYFAGKETRDKAMDLLTEAAYEAKKSGNKFITEENINSLIESKTGVAVGEVKEEEKDKLENLEEILHKRVIGQDEAVKSISQAIRRARSGIADPKKPLGTFLFLGPTGVGKTETAKTLAEVFFGDENKMIRLDMSEYNAPDALGKLIGSFDTGKVGVLVQQARDNPYTVLLLDEFEKTHQEVMDLFLQVFDEGMFSDMNGKKVSVRSMVIIATSNAGSDDIWNIVQSGQNLLEKKDEIVDKIIRKGTFKPELLNRFDAVVLFHPLVQEHLQGIAQKMLSSLIKRLEQRGILLSLDDSLVNYLVEKGSDPKFGARPLSRVIKDEIEEAVAKKIIAGHQKGEPIHLSISDISS